MMSIFTRERMKEKSDNFVHVVASDLGKFTFYTSIMSGSEGNAKRGIVYEAYQSNTFREEGLG